MSSLYITEHYAPSLSGGNMIPAVTMPPIAEQKLTISGTSAQSNAFNDLTQLIGVHTDVNCSVAVGVNPTASASNKRMVAGSTEYFVVEPGHKLAVISN